MTELEKKAKEYQINLSDDYLENTYQDVIVERAYIHGYEQGQKDKKFDIFSFQADLEKENAELKARNSELEGLLKLSGDNAEYCQILEAQIEKMKCVCNCKHGHYVLMSPASFCCDIDKHFNCSGCDKWELAK